MNNTLTFIENDFSREPKPAGLLMAAGFIATLVMVLGNFLVKAAQSEFYRADMGSVYASLFSPHAAALLFSTPWWMGLLFHVLIATMMLPLVFGYFARRYEILERRWIKGFAFGALLWLLTESILKPLAGFGFFSNALGYPAAEVLLNLAFWVTYGSVLNALARVPTAHEFEVSYRDAA